MEKRWQQKEEARRLRRLGLTFPEIQDRLFIHKVTLSRWCQDIELTPRQIGLHGKVYSAGLKGAKANYLKRQKEIKEIQKKAEKEIRKMSFYEFKIAGTALYWGEGTKKSSGLSFSNSDVKLVEFMMKWIREVCGVSDNRIKAYLYLHTGLDEEKMKKYWSKIINIPLAQFNKTTFKQEGSASRKYSEDKYKGTIKIHVSSEDLKHKVISWIEQLQYYT